MLKLLKAKILRKKQPEVSSPFSQTVESNNELPRRSSEKEAKSQTALMRSETSTFPRMKLSEFNAQEQLLKEMGFIPSVLITIVMKYAIHARFFLPTTYPEAFALLQDVAKTGHPWAQAKLAEYYQRGLSVPKNPSEGYRYAKMAAEEKESEGSAALGFCYQLGFGVEQNILEAIRLYKSSMAQDQNIRGYHQYGYCLMFGEGVEKDLKEGIRVTRYAAERGNPQAQQNLGSYYINGQGVEVDDNEAIKWFRLAAEQGYADGQYSVGYCHDTGRGADLNRAEALKYYKMAASQGCISALAMVKPYGGKDT